MNCGLYIFLKGGKPATALEYIEYIKEVIIDA